MCEHKGILLTAEGWYCPDCKQMFAEKPKAEKPKAEKKEVKKEPKSKAAKK